MSFKFEFPVLDTLFTSHPPKSDDKDTVTLKIVLSDYKTHHPNYRGHTTFNMSYINSTKFPNIRDTGAFFVIVNSTERGGANAIYCISRGDPSKSGDVNTLVKSNGIKDSIIELSWQPFEYPVLSVDVKLYEYPEKPTLYYYVRVISCF